jgi:pheromone shutdown protein TraB
VLNNLCGTTHLSEEGFVQFVKETLTSNPDCLSVEQDNSWDSN